MAKLPELNADEWAILIDFYRAQKGKIPSKTSLELQELSELLLRVRNFTHPVPPNTRNAPGMYLQLKHIAALDPAAVGGMKPPAKLARDIWERNKAWLVRHAAEIKAELTGDEDGTIMPLKPFGASYAPEGQMVSRIHWRRERNAALVERCKRAFFAKHDALFCELCAFNYADRYGSHGERFIECHHTRPLSSYPDPRSTSLEELLLVCANCHRMIHHRSPWLTPEKMRKILG